MEATAQALVPCSWCGLLNDGGPVCDVCGSPAVDAESRTTVLRIAERGSASRAQATGEPQSDVGSPQATPLQFWHAPTAAPSLLPAQPAAQALPQPPVRPARPRRRAARSASHRWLSWTSAQPQPEPVSGPVDPRFLLVPSDLDELEDDMWLVRRPEPEATKPTVVPAVPLVTTSAQSSPELAGPPAFHPNREAWIYPPSLDERRYLRNRAAMKAVGGAVAAGGVAELIDLLLSYLLH